MTGLPKPNNICLLHQKPEKYHQIYCHHWTKSPLDKPCETVYNITVQNTEIQERTAVMDKEQLPVNDNENIEEDLDAIVYTLTDEEGNELNFSLLGTLENEGAVYKALIPVDENGEEESDEYVILKCGVDENGEEVLETIEDDDEFDRIADIFDDHFSDIFYDDET